MLQLQLSSLLLIVGAAALIPREKIISVSTEYRNFQLSPDGKMIGYIASDSNTVKNVFTWSLIDGSKRQVTFHKSNVNGYHWTGVENTILFEADNNGDENVMLHKQNITEKAPDHISNISEKPESKMLLAANNQKESYVIISMNEATSPYNNIYKFDLLTNQFSRILFNQRFSEFYFDNNMQLRFAREIQPDGTQLYFRPSSNANLMNLTSENHFWEEYLRVPIDDIFITSILGFDKSNENAFWIYGEKSNFGDLLIASVHNFNQSIVAYKAVRSEIQSTLFHNEDRTLLALSEYYHKSDLIVLNNTVEKDIQYLKNLRPDTTLSVLSTSLDMQVWLVKYVSSERSEIFVYRRRNQTAQYLYNLKPELEGYTVNKQIGFDFKARDGLTVQAYLSLPPHVSLKKDVPDEDQSFAQLGMIPAEPQRLVLLVHGGPHSRDTFASDDYNILLTNRGYAVLQVNFRGSTGFGKDFRNAGNGEWSKKMQTDLLDAVDFVVSKGIANRSEIAIMGGSYGGYAALVGLTFTPETFACGVDIVGVSNLITFLNAIPQEWLPYRPLWIEMAGGDPNTEEGRKALLERSPLSLAHNIKKPILIMQGANDPRVKQRESDQFVDSLRNNSIPFTYVLYPDEGHGFRRIPNHLAEFGFIETFLHDCLGGDVQPFTRGQYNESAIVQELNK